MYRSVHNKNPIKIGEGKRRWRGRRDTRGINKEDDGEELGRESIWKRMEIVRRIMMRK
jgi:hypothetical protein